MKHIKKFKYKITDLYYEKTNENINNIFNNIWDEEEYPDDEWVNVPEDIKLPKNTKIKIKNIKNITNSNKIGFIKGQYKGFNLVKFTQKKGEIIYLNRNILIKQKTLNNILNKNENINFEDWDEEESPSSSKKWRLVTYQQHNPPVWIVDDWDKNDKEIVHFYNTPDTKSRFHGIIDASNKQKELIKNNKILVIYYVNKQYREFYYNELPENIKIKLPL